MFPFQWLVVCSFVEPDFIVSHPVQAFFADALDYLKAFRVLSVSFLSVVLSSVMSQAFSIFWVAIKAAQMPLSSGAVIRSRIFPVVRLLALVSPIDALSKAKAHSRAIELVASIQNALDVAVRPFLFFPAMCAVEAHLSFPSYAGDRR